MKHWLIASGVLIAGFVGLATGQPSISRGQQILEVGYDECLRRAQAAFAAEQWSNIGTSGNAVAAFKGIHGSYIVCNPGPDSKMAVNIFVASTTNDSGVPGAERQKLQGRIGSPGTTTSSPILTSCWRWDVELKNGSRVDAVLVMTSDGKASIQKWGLNNGTWTAQGSQYTFDWGRGPGKQDTMTMSGNTLTGSNFETNWIRGTLINCN